MTASTAPARARFQGAVQIVRFNWPWYAAAVVLVAVGVLILETVSLDRRIAAAVLAGVGLAVFWLASSVVVSHAVYDRSAIASGGWLGRTLPGKPRTIANFHAGLDETSPLLSSQFPAARLSVFCFYDDQAMKEASIERARRRSRAEEASVPIDFAQIPMKDGALCAAFVVFSAHELRDASDRLAFFEGLRRVLDPEGDLVVVEHVRNAWNVFAFGPGSRHFLTRSAWLRSFGGAGFTIREEFRVTPFVTVFRLRSGPPPREIS